MRAIAASILLGILVSATVAAETNEQLVEAVRAREIGFAKTMADRNLAAFSSYLAPDAVFFGESVARGRDAVTQAWKGFYEGDVAPFSWKPESVEVLESGTLAFSSGPVLNQRGEQIAEFNSVWQRQPDGQWKVVFDKGCRVCRCK